MRFLKTILIILIFSKSICHAQQNNTVQKYKLSGFINKKIPVELNISISNQLILGDIRYLGTRSKQPIKIIGRVENQNQYSLHEFQRDGNISGIIDATLINNKLEGEWYATKSDTSYAITLTLKTNQNLKQEIFSPLKPDQLAGEYAYQYGEKGYQGSITIKKESGNTYSYDIGSVTRDPGRNIADASGKAILKNDQLIIQVNKSCKFKVKFYNGFLVISQEGPDKLNDCEFGFNATLEGTYLKIK